MGEMPQNNENQRTQARYILSFDAIDESGNVFWIIGHARSLLEGRERKAFMDAINTATAPDAGKNYEDILAIVNEYVQLVDTSGNYPQYAPTDEQRIVDGTIIPE